MKSGGLRRTDIDTGNVMKNSRTILLAGAALTALTTGLAQAQAGSGDGPAFTGSPVDAMTQRQLVGSPTGAMTPRLIVRTDVGGATTPGEALDNSFDANDDWGSLVQIFLQNNTSGSIFFNCSGSLINPRTVLTAAHCLNSASSEAYGLPGQAPLTMLIGFGPDTSTSFFNYLGTGASYSQGGVASSVDVLIHPSSNLDDGGLPFPWADVAMIALNEPVSDVPTLGMLFSPLDQLTHVIMGGYGTFGTGDTGGLGIGFRRLIGENQLGMIGSPADLLDGIFPGFAPTAVNFGAETQTFYWIDFDDPDRTEGGCSFTGLSINCASLDAVKAIDWFDGDALPNEAGTAGGDSGSPLIADQLADFPLILGVLSGGFDFFGIGNQYSDISFYNPLFPFYEFISANSPYKYVSAFGGDGLWTDPDHWTQDFDPNFFIIEDGELVNGLPPGREEGVYSSEDKVGLLLGNDISGNDPTDSPLLPPRDAGAAPAGESFAGSLTDGEDRPAGILAGQIDTALLGGATPGETGREIVGADGEESGTSEADREVVGTPVDATAEDEPGFGNNLPQSSVLQGEGSTGFVPDNTDGIVGVAWENPAQYFDVSFTRAGTTTLTGTSVTVDQVSLLHGGATLAIEDALLDSLIGTNVMIGTLDVGEFGVLLTPLLINDLGIVTGSGLIVADLFLNRGGIVDPDFTGVDDPLGELTLIGDYIQLSQGVLRIDIFDDLGTATSNDLFNIFGTAALDGTLMTVVPDAAAVPRGSEFTVLTASNGVLGEFSNEMTQYSATLSFDVSYQAGAVTLTAVAEDFADALAGAGRNTLAVAGALDAVTSPDELPSGDLGAMINSLDSLPSGNALNAALTSMSPVDTLVFDQLGFTAARSFNSLLSQRPRLARQASGGFDASGLTFRSGNVPIRLASASQNTSIPASYGRNRILPDNVTAFISGDVAFGEDTRTALAGEVESAAVTVGLENRINRYVTGGVALTGAWFEAGEGDRTYDGDSVGIGGYLGASRKNVYLTANLGYVAHSFQSERPVFTGAGFGSAGGETEATQLLAGIEAGLTWSLPIGGEWGPVARLRSSSMDIDAYQETGAGAFGSSIAGRSITETVSSLGVSAWAPLGEKVFVSGEFTAERYLEGDEASTATATLIAAPNSPFVVTGAALDQAYYALRLGAGYRITPGILVSARYEVDIDRADFDYQRAMIALNFGF